MKTADIIANQIPQEFIDDFERNHWFVDWKTTDLPSWIRKPLVQKDDVKRLLLRLACDSNVKDIRVMNENDLSKMVSQDGVKMTLREMHFGSRYQHAHEDVLVLGFPVAD